jgi:serine/threonine protein kinase
MSKRLNNAKTKKNTNNWVMVSKRSSRLPGHKRDAKPDLFRKDSSSLTEVDCEGSQIGGSGAYGETQICTGRFRVGVTDFKRLDDQAWSYRRKGYVSVKRIQEQTFKCVVKYMKVAHTDDKSVDIDKINKYYIDNFEKERNLLLSIQGHPNIVNIMPNIKVRNPMTDLIYSSDTKERVIPYYIMEYCTEGDCNKFVFSDVYENIYQNKQEFSQLVRNYISDVYSGIKYIHSKGYIHCDIKPGNIFVTKPDKIQPTRTLTNSLVFKIGDMGGMVKSTDEPHTYTAIYAPPKEYAIYVKHFIDYYGFALSLYHFIVGRHARNPTIQSDLNNPFFIRRLFAVDDWVDGALTDDVLQIVRDIFSEMNELEKSVIGIVNDYLPRIKQAAVNDTSYFTSMNLINELNAKLALDTPMYQRFYSTMSALNNYKFTHISNQITNADVSSAVIKPVTASARIKGAVNWFKRLATGKPVVKPITKSQRIQRLARTKKQLLKRGANVTVTKGSSKRVKPTAKSTRMQRIKRTLKNFFKR